MINCPVCNYEAQCFQKDMYDDRYACPGLFEIYQCLNCAHSFLLLADETIESEHLYTEYYPRATFDPEKFTPKTFAGGFTSWLNGDACAACKWVPKEVRVLDVGCGFCETLAYHRARGCDVVGVEADKNVKAVADKYQFTVDIGPFDPEHYAPESFDYVTMNQVIEHFENPMHELMGVAQILRAGGRVVITTPNSQGWGAWLFGRKWVNWHVPYHRHFFSKTSMQNAAESVGLTVETVRTITSSEWLRYQWVHLLTCPGHGEPSSFWSPYAERNLLTRVTQKITEVLHYGKINHLITRCLDRMSLGDNYLFVLKKQ